MLVDSACTDGIQTKVNDEQYGGYIVAGLLVATDWEPEQIVRRTKSWGRVQGHRLWLSCNQRELFITHLIYSKTSYKQVVGYQNQPSDADIKHSWLLYITVTAALALPHLSCRGECLHDFINRAEADMCYMIALKQLMCRLIVGFSGYG